MEDLFNILSSAARIDKSKRKKRKKTGPTNGSAAAFAPPAPAPAPAPAPEPHDDAASGDDTDDDDDGDDDGDVAAAAARRPRKERPVKRHSAVKLAQVRREEMAAFRRRVGIRLSDDNRREVSAGTMPDAAPSFEDWKRPSWWNDGDGDDGDGGDDGPSSSHATSNDDTAGRKSESKSDRRVAKKTTTAKTTTTTTTTTANGRDLFRGIRRAILANVEGGRWAEPTPIQMQAVPCLSERRDVLGCAPTGSGKTGAFVLPAIMLARCDGGTYHGRRRRDRTTTAEDGSSRAGRIRTIFLAPSRELASQLCREVLRLSSGVPGGKFHTAVLSKSNAGLAIANRLGGKDGLDCLVSTPLRLVECLERGMKLRGVRMIVLDEADRLLDACDGIGGGDGDNKEGQRKREDRKDDGSDGGDDDDGGDEDDDGEDDDGDDDGGGIRKEPQRQSGSSQSRTFLQQIDSILSEVPPSATRALFSATLGPSVRRLSESILRSPIDVTVGSHAGTGGNGAAGGASEHVKQELKFVGREEGKLLEIRQLVNSGITPPVLIFLQSKERAQALFHELLYDGMRVDVIHAGRSHSERELSVQKFRRGDTWVLICTDLVARGVDFKAVNLVINYDLPTDGVSYVHRIGRTGRAGREGRAITFFTEADFDNLRTIANVMRLSGCEVPEWMLTMKKKRPPRDKRGNKYSAPPPRRGDIDTTPRYDKDKKKRKRSKNRTQKDY
jgi:ATP-dependent RNA helicase DDX52/ROK1